MERQFNQKEIERLCRQSGISLLVLHGSYAKGTATDKSDIDVGILSQHKTDPFKIFRDFGGIFGDKFDPVFLNNAEPMISYQVALSGKPLFESAKGVFNNFKVTAIARYQDTKKFRDLEKYYIKKAVGKSTDD